MNPLKYLLQKYKSKRHKLKHRGIYACTTGDHVGKFFVFVEEKPENEQFRALTFPEMELLYIKEKDVIEGIEKKILDLVDIVPKDVYELCVAEFNHRTKIEEEKEEKKYNELNNRWKQLAS